MFGGAELEGLDRPFWWLALSYSITQQLYFSLVLVEVIRMYLVSQWLFRKRKTGLHRGTRNIENPVEENCLVLNTATVSNSI